MATANRVVTSERYPYLQVRFAIRGVDQTALAYVDTGFEGYLSIPESEGLNLGLPDREAAYQLADGSMVALPVYLGMVELVGFGDLVPARVLVSGVEYLLGREAIDQFRLTFDRGTTLTAEL